MSVLDAFPATVVSLQTNTGSGSVGTIFAAPVDVNAFVEDARRNVRASDGELTVSETTLYDQDLTHADLWLGGSRVTVNGRSCIVIVTKRRVIGDADVDHLEIALT